MEYCKNENLEKIGRHILGVYPDRCFLCKEVKKEKKEKISAKKFVSYEDLREEFREETILANNWLKWKL